MATRRKIGPAYERAPAEKIGEWSLRNMLTLASALFLTIAFWWVFNIVVDGLLNFLATGGNPGAEQMFFSDHPVCIALKVLGAIGLITFLLKTRTK